MLPADLALLVKGYITLDGLGRHLNPDFNTLVFAEPYIQKIMMERYKPEAIAKMRLAQPDQRRRSVVKLAQRLAQAVARLQERRHSG